MATNSRGNGKGLTMTARGGTFVALILGLILLASKSTGFLADGYLWIVAAHVAVGVLAVAAGYAVVGLALRGLRTGASARGVKPVGMLVAAVLTLMLGSGIVLLLAVFTTGASDLGRTFHLVLAFVTIAALVALGLVGRTSSKGA